MEPLKVCRFFFESLNTHKIRYCHWKSNDHLLRALCGKTDLDILVHIDDKRNFEEILKTNPFKKIISPPEKQFKGMEDYLGFDENMGSFIHLHVHYRLILGEKYIKNHHLPIESLILNNLVKEHNVYIPCPEIELIMLIIRAHMKTDLFSLVKHAVNDFISKGYTAFPSDIEGEFKSLISKSDMCKVLELLYQSNLPITESLFIDFIKRFSEKKLKSFQILFARWKILNSLKDFRRSKNILVYFRYFYFFVYELTVVNKFKVQRKKTLPGRGRIISLVGADGSGKSTLINDLEKWLSWKLTVKKYYYGIPKNSVNKANYFFVRIFRKLNLTLAADFIETLFWIYVARKRYLISLKSQEDIQVGNIVISDRFPLKDFHDMPEPMDGPRLKKNRSKFWRYFKKCELEYYNKINIPDQIFVLQVKIEELRRRKTDLGLEIHKIKADAINALKDRVPLVLINANRQYSDVQLEIKKHIWAIF